MSYTQLNEYIKLCMYFKSHHSHPAENQGRGGGVFDSFKFNPYIMPLILF